MEREPPEQRSGGPPSRQGQREPVVVEQELTQYAHPQHPAPSVAAVTHALHEDLDGYTVGFETFREDADAGPLMKGLPDGG
jgi:hypothetical protein